MLQVAAGNCPGEPGFVRPVESERLALERREQLVRTIPVWPSRAFARAWRKRPEYECGPPASNGQRQHRPHLLERSLRTKPLICKPASGQRDAIVQRNLRRHADGGAENGLALAERIAELGVVPVEQEI